MKPKVVSHEEFDRLVLKELVAKFHAAVADGSTVEVEGKEFVQLKTSLDFIVSARKKKPDPPDDEPEPPVEEPCCVCFRSGQGIVCSGDCCIEVFLPSD